MKYIIATHGKMASGIKDTVEMLAGKREDVYALDAYTENQEFAETFEKLLEDFKGEYVYVFTDIISGSVNQAVAGFLKKYRIHLITGVNLPIIMEIVLRDEELNDQEIAGMVEEARQHLLYMNALD